MASANYVPDPMTVNIGLLTSDALVLGCDSVASTSKHYLDPFSVPWEKDAEGKFVTDEGGRFGLKFVFDDLDQVVTSAWGGVTKMFQIHPDPSPVVAVTAGLAVLQGRTIASHADEFYRKHRDKRKTKGKKKQASLVGVEEICRAFLQFMRRRYLAHYKDSPLPDRLKQGPVFLVGGIGRDDAFPSLYRVSVEDNSMECDFPAGDCGIAWAGQADAVQRFIHGYDGAVRSKVEMKVAKALQDHVTKTHDYITELVNGILDQLQQPLPTGVEIKIPTLEQVSLGWEDFSVPIDYRNFPLQEAVNFVSAMVMSQASRARFATGVATVGGRTHIGVVTKAAGFRALNEPDIVHRFTGLSDDV